MANRYDDFVKRTQADEGMSSPSEAEEEPEAETNPAIVMVDETTGCRYMRLVKNKGLAADGEGKWLIDDLSVS